MNARELLLGGVAAVALGGGLLVAPPFVPKADAQTSVQQSAAKLDAGTSLTGPAGGRTTCTTTQDSVANLTVTLTPTAGNFVYITGIDIQVASNVTGATSAVAWSTTGLTGNGSFITTNVAGATTNVAPNGGYQVNAKYPTGLKSITPGTAVVLTPSATMASASQCPQVAWYQTPS